MGLSASQARLLSITQRISNNELEAEIIANSKMRLAEKNTAASDKYIAALDSTKLNYISYNDTGIQETVALTFNTINQYNPLKNQYSLYNTENQILVSQTDADNFAKSNDLHSFLNCYGLFDQGIQENAAARAQYDKDLDDYDENVKKYNEALNEFNNKTSDEWVDYLAKKTAWDEQVNTDYLNSSEYKMYEEKHAIWQETQGAANPYEKFTAVVGTSDSPSSCYSNALRYPTSDCYRHVLAHLIDLSSTGQDHETSVSGKKVHVSVADASGSALGTNPDTLKEAREAIQQKYSTEEYIINCDGDDDLSTDGEQNILKQVVDAGGIPSDFQTLMSDYYIIKDGLGNPVLDEDGSYTYGIKSVFQKAIDMMYIIKNQSEFGSEVDATSMKNLLINFTDGDMANMNFPEPQPPEKPNNPYPYPEPTFRLAMPTEPTPPKETAKIYDKPLAQWYINLWYAMDGMDKSEVLRTVADEEANFDYYAVDNLDRNSTFDNFGQQVNQYYKVIDKELAGDTNWIHFALNNGIVTMKQASVRMDGDITWSGIEVGSTSDISEVDDSTKIAKAEAEYTQSRAQIQAEDKKFDAEIKKLDTEHSALQAEVESIKTVLSKNVETSFAAFS